VKLASLNRGRDGRLMVVSGDLARAAPADYIAPTLQAALDDWATVAPRLEMLWRQLDSGALPGFAFDPRNCASPLPRAFQWADGSAYVNHVALVRQARGAELPRRFWTDPLIYQGGSDYFLPPTAPIRLDDPEWGLDFEAEIAVITGDVPQGASKEEARNAILLVMLCNDVSLRGLIPDELAKGFGFFQSKPASSFSPVAVTPQQLGDHWLGGKLHLPLVTRLNGEDFGRPNSGVDMTFDFPTLIAHAARTRKLQAGTIIGSGTVSNRGADGGPGRPIAKGGVGYSCLAELRVVEQILEGEAKTPFMRVGDHVSIEMLDPQGHSIFGRIEQEVVGKG
jgi:fumarylacetoacetate (FAA) hydrolase